MVSKTNHNTYCILFAIIFSFSNCYIYMIEKNSLVDQWDYLLLLYNVMVIGVLCYTVILKITLFQMSKLREDVGAIHFSDIQYFCIVAVMIFLLWLPVFLAYYPGIFAYDVMDQIPQKAGSYNTHHPLIHTLYLQFFYYYVGKYIFNNYNIGIALASIVQMGLFSLMLSFSHLYLRRVGLCKTLRILLIILNGILTVFSMLALSMTKDTLFAGFVSLMFTFLCYQLTPDLQSFFERCLYKIFYIISVVGVITLRNNGIYPVAILAVILSIGMLKRRNSFHILCYTVFGLLTGITFLICLKNNLHATPGSKNEMLSLPYQQLACAYIDNHNKMSEDELLSIVNIIPDVDNYNPCLSDNIKFSAKGADNIKYLIATYIHIGFKYPQSYLKSFFVHNAGYFGLTDTSFSRIYGTTNRQGIFLSDTKDGFGIEHTSYFPELENLYERLYTSNAYEYVFGLNLLCHPAFYMWLICFSTLCIVIRKAKMFFPMCAFLFAYILTGFAGPCVLIRYALPYIACTPQLFISAIRTGEVIDG